MTLHLLNSAYWQQWTDAAKRTYIRNSNYWPATFIIVGLLLIIISSLWTTNHIAFATLCLAGGLGAMAYGIYNLRSGFFKKKTKQTLEVPRQYELHYDDLALPLLRILLNTHSSTDDYMLNVENATDIMVRITIIDKGQCVAIQLFDTSADTLISLTPQSCYYGEEAKRMLRLLEE